MTCRITWRDRIRAVGRNCRRDPGAAWFAVLLVVMIVVFVFGLTGCEPVAVREAVSDPAVELAQFKAELAKERAGTSSLTKAVSVEHQAAVDAQRQVEVDRGKLASDEKALEDATAAELVLKREAELAPLRTTLRWAEGISLLGMLAGFGLAAAALFWGLGFTWKIPAGIAVCFGAVLVTALAAGAALNHLGLIVGAIGILAAAGIAWLAYRHLSVVDAARKAWDAVPDAAPVEAKAEALLDRLMKAKGA